MDELSEVFSGTKPLTRIEKNGKLWLKWLSDNDEYMENMMIMMKKIMIKMWLWWKHDDDLKWTVSHW
jgi:hypothetical protein